MTYTLRLDKQIAFSQSKTAFIFAVLIKIALVTFFIWLFKDFYKKVKSQVVVLSLNYKRINLN